MAEGQGEKTARVLDGITELPTPPTPQLAQPLDSMLHEIINPLDAYTSMSQILFPFIKRVLVDAKSQNPNSALSDNQSIYPS